MTRNGLNPDHGLLISERETDARPGVVDARSRGIVMPFADDNRIRTLLIDDDEEDVALFRGLLEESERETEGGPAFEMDQARTLDQARECLDRGRVDVALVDVCPETGAGMEIVAELTRMAPDLPIVVATRGREREALQKGAVDCIDTDRLDSYWLNRALRYAINRKEIEREKRRMEEQLWASQKMESLGELAGGVAHDFNNLLCGILGNASLARETVPENSTAGECLRDIERVAERATVLCRQMLAYAGGRQAMAEEFDLNELVSEKPELLRTSISKEARLTTRIAPEAIMVHADRSQIGQIILNLVVNASDALNGLPGDIELTTGVVKADAGFFADAELRPELPPGEYACLSVTDSGCGMDEETRARIFEPFFTTKFVGRGMGLPAALGIVRSHGGAFKVDSQPGKGTRVSVYLPFVGSTLLRGAEPAKATEDWSDRGTVLLVDDEEPVRDAASRFLKRLGYSVIEAVDGVEGFERFMSNRGLLRAVIMDLTMPGLDGGHLCAEIRKVDPAVPILLMSGYSRSEVMHRVEPGLNLPFMQKPFRFPEFRDRMRQLLEPESGA